jgi:DNA polymerase I-like protein with 3'-5' exonuclease and polymerase domains
MEEEHRITTAWQLAGTETLRLASRKLLSKWGDNLQNKSDKVAQLFIPDPGKVFIQVDQAGAEALVVSYLTRHGRYRDLFLHGIKCHLYVALKLFTQELCDELKIVWPKKLAILDIPELAAHKEWPEVARYIKQHKTFYDLAKRTGHAANYGMRGNTFRINVLQKTEGKTVLTSQQAETFLGKYHAAFPEIKEWHAEVKEVLNSSDKTLRNLQGYPCEFPVFFANESNIKDAIAWVPQSTVGTISNIAYTNFQNYIEDNDLRGWDLLNNKHDSYMAQIPVEDTERAIPIMVGFMEQELTSPRGEKFKMKAEASVGKNWGKWSEKNPEGLKEL